jgi:hypothetical protein
MDGWMVGEKGTEGVDGVMIDFWIFFWLME